MKKFLRALSALILGSFALTGCGNKSTDSSEPPVIGENGVGELIAPDPDSKEYDLGSYRFDENGIKLYYDDSDIPAELMLALENYFLSFQNEDFEAYKNALDADYAERYDKYLRENFSGGSEDGSEYTLQNSFEGQCSNIKELMLDEMGVDSDNSNGYTGKLEITRIRGERPVFSEDETEESFVKSYFSYSDCDNIFDMDYYNFVAEQVDGFECLTFFIIANGEDGEEHRILSAVDIVFAEKDGKYYTFG